MIDYTKAIGKTLTTCDASGPVAVLTFSDGAVIRCYITEILTKEEYSAKVEAEKIAAKAIYDALVIKTEEIKAIATKVL